MRVGVEKIFQEHMQEKDLCVYMYLCMGMSCRFGIRSGRLFLYICMECALAAGHILKYFYSRAI